MTYRIAINGFGRIGRNYLRRLTDKALANEGLQVVAINDLYDAATLAHLLEYDSTFGRIDTEVGYEAGRLIVGWPPRVGRCTASSAMPRRRWSRPTSSATRRRVCSTRG